MMTGPAGAGHAYSPASTRWRQRPIHAFKTPLEAAAANEKAIMRYTQPRLTLEGWTGSNHIGLLASLARVASPMITGHRAANRNRRHRRGMASRYSPAAA